MKGKELRLSLSKFFFALIFSLILIVITGCTSGKKEEDNIVNVYNWGEYIDEDLLDKFEKETGIKVQYEMFVTNEDMYVKVKNSSNNYDVIIPSDYMVEKMINDDLVQKINFKNIPNYKYIDEAYKKMAFDPKDEYSIPYFWGTMGILYNKKMVKSKIDSWNDLWDPRYKGEIVMLDSSRDSIAISLIRNGFDLNSTDTRELEKAKRDLIEQFPIVMAYQVDQTKDIMQNKEAVMGVVYSGDALLSVNADEDLAYVVPKEGSNIWVDSMVIPKKSKHLKNAEKFINFMLDPENMAQNAEYVEYSVPSSQARNLLPDYLKNSEIAYPDMEKMPKLKAFKDLKDKVRLYDDIWQDVKNQ